MTAPEPQSRFAPAARLGPYEVLGPVGKGGMGEVYRAKDTRLDREVAIKVLPPGLANDEQFRARFEREAKSVSALNHPHICTLHDIGQEVVKGETIHYLVLEMIEGESLAARLARAPLSLDDVLLYGKQIASALDAAHRRGIVHRDLKPGNVMITKAGAKLLDFGLATAGARGAVQGLSSLETAGTMDKPLTEQGTIMGTFQYMSPEQLEGMPADTRADIFALGAVLYEMTTGRKAFEGKNRTSLIAAIVSSQPPPVSTVQAMSPPALDHVIRKCLEKDPDDRWQSARDVMAELQWIAEGGSRAGLPAAVSLRRRNRENIAWGLSALLALSTLGFAYAWTRRAPSPSPLMRFALTAPDVLAAAGPPNVSPDGRYVAFVGTEASGKAQIWIRPLDAVEARPLAGTDGAHRPFWSPDSRSLGFFTADKLRKISVTGGPSQAICTVNNGADGTWSETGVIVFDGQQNEPIRSCDAAGGVVKTEVESGEVDVGWPEFLPDGRHFLYMSGLSSSGERTLMVRAVGEPSGKELFKTASKVAYAPPGYLVYVREKTLVAQPFDAARQQITGEPIPVGEGVGVNGVGGASFSLSRNGVLAYRANENMARRLVWMDRSGKESKAFDEPARYYDTTFSPDESRVAYDMEEEDGKNNVWVRDWARGVTTRFSLDTAMAEMPQWSPDGRRIAYSIKEKVWNLFVKNASGSATQETLLSSNEDKFITDWTSDGAYVIFTAKGKETSWDLWALPMQGDRKPISLVNTPANEFVGVVSPDRRYLAYTVQVQNRMEIYVQEFPQGRGKWQVTTNGGTNPSWRADGREFYYVSDGNLMAVPVKTVPEFETGTPQVLFTGQFATSNVRSVYRPSRDGQRFLVLTTRGVQGVAPATLVLNWTTLLK